MLYGRFSVDVVIYREASKRSLLIAPVAFELLVFPSLYLSVSAYNAPLESVSVSQMANVSIEIQPVMFLNSYN